jgi:hypothetical protein
MGQTDSNHGPTTALIALVVVIVGLLVVTILLFGEAFFVRPRADISLPWIAVAVGLLLSASGKVLPKRNDAIAENARPEKLARKRGEARRRAR